MICPHTNCGVKKGILNANLTTHAASLCLPDLATRDLGGKNQVLCGVIRILKSNKKGDNGLCDSIRILKCNKKGDHGESLTPERRRYNVLCRQRTELALGYSQDTKNSKDHKLHDR